MTDAVQEDSIEYADSMLSHIAGTPSQYDSTCRDLATLLLVERARLSAAGKVCSRVTALATALDSEVASQRSRINGLEQRLAVRAPGAEPGALSALLDGPEASGACLSRHPGKDVDFLHAAARGEIIRLADSLEISAANPYGNAEIEHHLRDAAKRVRGLLGGG